MENKKCLGVSNMLEKTINISRDFSRFPAGRLRGDGKFSAETFREDILLPQIKDSGISRIIIELDGAAGYSSSFLEETFGGLVRAGLSKRDINNKIFFNSSDKLLIDEINQYIDEA